MDSNPDGCNCLLKSLILFVRYNGGSVPSSASIQHVENDEFVDEEKIALDLEVEIVGQFNAARVAWPGLLPLSADSTGLHNLWDEVKDFLRNPNSFQEALHGVL